MDQYPHLARVRQNRERFSTIDSLILHLKEEKKGLGRTPLRKTLSWREIEQLERTCRLVESELRGRFRDDGSPEFSHALGSLVIAVIENGIRDLAQLQATVCHDLMEDIPNRFTYHWLAACTSQEAAGYVMVCTRDRNRNMYPTKEAQNDTYYTNVAEKKPTAQIKLADNPDNLLTLSGLKANRGDMSPLEKLDAQESKLQETIAHVIPMAQKYDCNVQLIEELVAWNWERIRAERAALNEAQIITEDRDA